MKLADRRTTARILLALGFFTCAEQAMTATGGDRVLNEQRAAGALFGQFETVLYSKPALLSGTGAYRRLSKQDADSLRHPFAYLRKGLDFLGKPSSAEVLADAEAVLVGTKDFRSPKGLGMVRSRRCYVLVLRRGSTFDLKKHFHEGWVAAAFGEPVLTWSAKLEEFGEGDPRPSSLYAAQVFSTYANGVVDHSRSALLVSNDLKELQALALRLNMEGQDDPLRTLTKVREWERVRKNNYWSYRRYRHAGIADRVAAGMTDVSPATEALSFSVDFERKSGALRLLSSTADDGTVKKIDAWLTKLRFPPFKPRGGTAWETTIRLTGDEKSLEGMFGVLYFFGFGGYV